jgi:hypothetical protein
MKVRDRLPRIALSAALVLICTDGAYADNSLRRVVFTGQTMPNQPPLLGTDTFDVAWDPGLNETGRTFFQSENNVGGSYRLEMWKEASAGGLSLVASEGLGKDGTAPYVSGLRDYIAGNENDQLYFLSDVMQPPDTHTIYQAIWSNLGGRDLKLVAMRGMQAPGFPSDVMFSGIIENPVINNHGYGAFASLLEGAGVFKLLGGNLVGGDQCIWMTDNTGTPTLVARAGDHPAGMPADARFGLDDLSGIAQIDDLNDVYFTDSIANSTFNGPAILRYRAGEGITPIIKAGDQAPGLAPGIQLTSAGFDINSRGFQVARSGAITVLTGLTGPGVDFTNNSALWSGESPTDLKLVVRQGQPVPGLPGHIVGLLEIEATNATGGTLIKVEQTDGSISPTDGYITGNIRKDLWKFDAANGLQFVAREGEQPPGTPAGVVFGQFMQSTINDAGQVAFRAQLYGDGVNSTNEFGIWAQDRAGILRLIARTGDLIDVDDGPGEDLRVLTGVSAKLSGTYLENDGFNNLGQIALAMAFDSGWTEGVFISNAATVPEPAAILLVIGVFGWFAGGRRGHGRFDLS